MKCPIAQQKVLDIQSFVENVNLKPGEAKAQKKQAKSQA